MKIALISSLTPGTGNHTTARRIEGHLRSAGHEVGLVNVLDSEAAVKETIQNGSYDSALGLHAFHSGNHLRLQNLPFGIIFGGTDLNEDVKNAARLDVMSEAVGKARGLVAFSEDFLGRARAIWPEAEEKLVQIPQGVAVAPSSFSIRDHLTLPSEAEIFLLPAGLRSVKDPLLLVECIADWHARDSRIHLVIAGERRDARYAEEFERKIEGKKGVILAGSMPQPDLHAAMRDSRAVLNTSLSECTPNAILEAMSIGAPVIARDIPGNAALIMPGQTGFLFTTPLEFIALAERLLDDESLRQAVTKNAREYVEARHGLSTERRAYQDLVNARLTP